MSGTRARFVDAGFLRRPFGVTLEDGTRFSPSIRYRDLALSSKIPNLETVFLCEWRSNPVQKWPTEVPILAAGRRVGSLAVRENYRGVDVLVRSEEHSDATAWEVLSDAAMNAVAACQHVLLLHCSALLFDGLQVVVLGESGCGKTTLAAAAEVAGGQALADDVVAVRLGSDRQAEAQAADNALRVRKKTAMAFGFADRKDTASTERDQRWDVPLRRNELAGRWSAPGALWLSSLAHESEETSIRRVEPALALAHVLRGAGVLLFHSGLGLVRDRSVQVAQALAEGVPAFEVVLGQDLLTNPELVLRGLVKGSAQSRDV